VWTCARARLRAFGSNGDRPLTLRSLDADELLSTYLDTRRQSLRIGNERAACCAPLLRLRFADDLG
jgi:hypothetical protein